MKEVKAIVELKEPPKEKCYEPVPNGTSGNMVLDKNCGWCPFKEICWADANGGIGLRKFKYSNGIEYFTQIVKEPKVEELQ